ncbi:MAG: recombinase family protein [Chloroflexi bacterium]|uniref:recombinase family protein n=1 Tax=Candidatus Flexifilum breve TaxID=3140694 RepID=UPI0031349B96|nr:recombinase family protein [Chloroflexota bacterium]
MPRPLKRPEQPIDPYKAQPLPLGRPAAVYYRQSSEGQIGNISTTLQTIDMIEHLLDRGWLRENVHMIDADAAVSGTKKIRERKGMTQLMQMIEAGQIGLVAAQDVDRFFRDVTMIETNLFIEACRAHNVQVMTPRMVYDFAHPIMGSSHIKMFREEAQRAADYLEYQIRGRLVKARHSRSAGGMWSGRKILPGFMVDCRAKVNEQRNPDFRKYKRFDLYADVILRYFEIFRENNGNLHQTWHQINEHGPYFPDIPEGAVPEGFKATDHLKRRSPFTKGLTPSHTGLTYMLVNVAYIGHWIHMGAVVQWNNHEAIIPLDLFMYAYNRLSPTDFHGEPNPNYVPYRPWIRHDKAERRTVTPPTYSGLIFSDDIPHLPHKRLASCWNTHAGKYQYLLYEYHVRSNIWNIKAFILDALIDEMLLARLRDTTIDEAAWAAALASFENVDQSEVRRLKAAIRQAETAKDNIIASLGLLSNAEMVARAQAHFEKADYEIANLRTELARIESGKQRSRSLVEARPALELVIARWDDVPSEEKRALFEAFAHYIKVTKVTRHTKHVTVFWRDGSTSMRSTTHKCNGYFWDEPELEALRAMIDSNVDQWRILREFPDYTWRSLQERYAYRYGNGYYPKHYAGKKPYNRFARWQDTAEYQAEVNASQLAASDCSIDRS